jgi:ATP-dependent RNA helicase DDX19/DBP5
MNSRSAQVIITRQSYYSTYIIGDKVEAQVVIGTPGTVADLIKRRALDVSKVKIFVLDEADNMLDGQGLGDQSVRVKK